MSAAVFVVGLLVTFVIAARKWEALAYRLLPFGFATICVAIVAWYRGKSLLEAATFILGSNIAAAFGFFALWIETGGRVKQ